VLEVATFGDAFKGWQFEETRALFEWSLLGLLVFFGGWSRERSRSKEENLRLELFSRLGVAVGGAP